MFLDTLPPNASGLFFLPLSGSACWSVKYKKLFERSEFFLFSGEKYWSSLKSADGEFSFCFVFLLFGQKKNEKANTNKMFYLFCSKTKEPYLCMIFQKYSNFI